MKDSDKVSWSKDHKDEFIRDLQVLFDTYGLHSIVDLTAGYYNNKFTVSQGEMFFFTPKHYNKADADKAIEEIWEFFKKEQINKALDNKDEELFHKLLNPVCVTCKKPINIQRYMTCTGCGNYLCNECYESGHGFCYSCSSSNSRRRE